MSLRIRKKISRLNKGRIPWNKGLKNCYLKETLEKFSKSHKGISSGMKGKYHTPKTKRRMSFLKRGAKHPLYNKHHTGETKEKMRIKGLRYKGKNHPMFGKHHNIKTKKKISFKLIGNKNAIKKEK